MQPFPEHKTCIMGILNVTPDSFYDGGRYVTKDEALARARRIAEEGADIIDVGGESSRPGAKPVSAQEEIDRVCPVIEAIAGEIGLPVSVDTCKAAVAEEALRCGASIVNDISGMTFDPRMPGLVAGKGCHVVIMHMQGTPETMQIAPRYDDAAGEVYGRLEELAGAAIASGVKKEKIIIDPGIGFGKTVDNNYEILSNLAYFKRMGYPLLIGLSRKSLIRTLFEGEPGADTLPGTIALNSIAALYGADIIRVHDVKQHREALKAVERLIQAKKSEISKRP